MRKLVIASKNKGKVKEIVEILKELPFEVFSMEDVGVNIDIEETGKTFEENALIKATEIYNIVKEPVMADDSGLEVDFLDGKPGIYSARFAGEKATDEERNNKLLEMLKNVEYKDRSARFVCSIAVVLSEKDYFTVKANCEGFINYKPIGENGFGYDPLFYIPEYKMTTAEMDSVQKHKISHRGKALKMMVEELKKKK